MDAGKIVRMLEAILSTKERELTCAGLGEEQLARYVELELSGESPGEHLPHVQQHLTICPDCRREYGEVREVLRLERAGRWIEPRTQPVFDLSFLVPREEDAGLWTQTGARIRRYVHRIPALLLPQLEQSGKLPQGLQLSYVPVALSRMRGPRAETSTVSFRLTDTAGRLQIQVEVNRVGEHAAWIVVRPVDVMTQQPLSGASVGLYDERGQPLEVRAVGPGGLVRFKEVTIRRDYSLRIEQAQQTWEILLDLRAEGL